MRLALRHRGPDDEGVYLSAARGCATGRGEQRGESRCGLVHTRLSILDLSPAGHQPMSTSDGRYWITFNGEIYNFQELRQKLAAAGVSFHSHTDTEVILRLYEREGPDCVNHLMGMFAFAIWDAWEGTCFMARDPLGIKPLYFYRKGAKLIFASELRALLASEEVPRRLCLEALHAYFCTGSVQGSRSLIDGVHSLPAGSWLIWRSGKVEARQYWRIHFNPSAGSMPAAALTRVSLLDSLRRHFISDVPVGIFLSGGVDSTTLLALAQQFDFSELKTFSLSFDDPRINEGDIARRTSEYFGAKHHDWRVDASGAAALLADFLSKMDQPSIDGFNTFCISKHAHDHGIKAVLSGLGGDELFGGYGSFRDVPRLYHWSRRLEPVAPLRAMAGNVLERYASRPPLRRLGSYLRATPTMARAYATYRGIFTHDESEKLLRNFTGRELSEADPDFEENIGDPSLEDQVSRWEIENYMRYQLLRDSDTMSMAWGLELRVPFVDRQLFESVCAIPALQRLAPKKALLLKAVPEIPDWVSERPKQGFVLPFDDWFASDLKPEMDGIDYGTGVQVQNWYQKWSLLVLKRWCENLQISLPGAGL